MKHSFKWDKKKVFSMFAAAVLVTFWIIAFLSQGHIQTVKPKVVAEASVVHQKIAHMMVYVVGEVNHPGLYSFALDARVYQAVAKAGGLTKRADRAAINLAAVMEDGTEIVIPAKNAISVITTTNQKKTSYSTRSHKVQAGQHVLLNEANLSQLEQLPGVGPKKAQEILTYRTKHGKFMTLADLRHVKGIGQKLLASLEPFLSLR